MNVELHSAFVWDCESCGRENFHRAVEGDLNESAMRDLIDSSPVIELVAPDAQALGNPDVDGMQEMAAAALVTRISIAPKRVKCNHCGERFDTTIPVAEDTSE